MGCLLMRCLTLTGGDRGSIVEGLGNDRGGRLRGSNGGANGSRPAGGSATTAACSRVGEALSRDEAHKSSENKSGLHFGRGGFGEVEEERMNRYEIERVRSETVEMTLMMGQEKVEID